MLPRVYGFCKLFHFTLHTLYRFTGNSLMTAALDQTIITTNESGLNNSEPTEQSSLPEKPVLQPKETAPVTGNYVLNDTAGKPCIKVSMGVEYIVIEKKVGTITFSALFVCVSALLYQG